MLKILETERLSVHYLGIKDAGFILKLLNSPTWLEHIGDRKITTLEEAKTYILNGPVINYKEKGLGMYGIKLKETEEMIGICGLLKRDYLQDFDLGYAILPQYEMKGYAYEATSAVLEHCRLTMKINKIVAFTSSGNHKSIKLLEKLGMLYEYTFTQGGEECLLYGKAFSA